MATPGAATRQKTTAETLRDYQERIEQLENLVADLQEMFDNQSAELRAESPRADYFRNPPPPSDDESDSEDLPDAKVTLLDLFHGKSSEYESFMAQCSLVFAARPRAYKTDECKVLQVIARLRGVPLK